MHIDCSKCTFCNHLQRGPQPQHEAISWLTHLTDTYSMSFSESLRQDLIDLFIQDCSQIRALTFQSYRGSGYSDQPLDLRSFLLAISLNSEQNPKKACTPVFKVWTTDSPQLPYENERYG